MEQNPNYEFFPGFRKRNISEVECDTNLHLFSATLKGSFSVQGEWNF